MQLPCLYCGHPADQEDHIQPRCDGGNDERSNLTPQAGRVLSLPPRADCG
jgi:hypothetical protein